MSKPSLQEIRSAANVLFGMDIAKKTNERSIVRKRQVTHYVAHVVFEYGAERVGIEIGQKDHSTVLHGCNVIRKELPIYEDIAGDVRRLTAMCKTKDNNSVPKVLILELLKSKTIDPNVKVELNVILKAI